MCFLCLNSNHQARQCKFTGCPKCGKEHNSKLHLDGTSDKAKTDNQNSSNSNLEVTCATNSTLQSFHTHENWTMLATAVVHLYDNTGQVGVCRALLDWGSGANFITDKCAQNLVLLRTSDLLTIVRINSIKTKAQKLEPTVMSSKFSKFNVSLDFHVLSLTFFIKTLTSIKQVFHQASRKN